MLIIENLAVQNQYLPLLLQNIVNTCDTRYLSKMVKYLLTLTFLLIQSADRLNGEDQCTDLDNQRSIIQSFSPAYPVLVGKEDNPVFRINIVPPDDIKLELDELTIDLGSTTDIQDIEKVTIYYTGENADFSTKSIFGVSRKITHVITLQGSQKLHPENNYFWLTLTLDENANLDHIVEAQITKVLTDGKEHTVPAPENSRSKKIGYALRQAGQDGIHTYRIPGLATTNAGTLIGVYDMRRSQSGDLQGDIDVGMSRSTDGGQTWDPPTVTVDMKKWAGLPENANGAGDPSILVDRSTGTIWVAALWIHGNEGSRAWTVSKQGMDPQQTGQFVLVKSEDDGLTWSDPINITSQIKDPEWFLLLQGPGKGISMTDGTLIFPAQYKDQHQVPHATIVYSKDHGETWMIGSGAKSKTTEAQVVELDDQSLMLNMRDDRGNSPKGRNGKGARSVVITKDLGKTWVEHPSSRKSLPEPVCMASLIKHRYQGKDYLIFSNPADRYLRKNLTIKISTDQGVNWDENLFTLIDEGEGFGYSCLTSINESTIGILYEGSQAQLVFQRFTMKELLKK